MKKIFFSILIGMSNISIPSDSKEKYICETTEGYSKYHNFNSLYVLILDLIDSNIINRKISEPKKYDILIENNFERKKLTIKSVEEKETVVYTVNNKSQSSNFITSSLWDHVTDDENRPVSREIEIMLNRKKKTCSMKQQEDLEKLSEKTHCRNSNYTCLVPLTKQRREREDQLDQEETSDDKKLNVLIYQGPTTSPFRNSSRSSSPDPKEPEIKTFYFKQQANKNS